MRLLLYITLSCVYIFLPFLNTPVQAAALELKKNHLKEFHQANVNYVAGEVIVKFKDSVTGSFETALEEEVFFKNIVSDQSDSLDLIFSRFPIVSATGLFLNRKNLKTAEAKIFFNQKIEEIKYRFPTRSQRIPVDAVLPNLVNIYLIKVSENSDTMQLIRELENNPHVAYAQPNYFIETNFTPNDPYFNSSGSWGQDIADLWGLHRIAINSAWNVTQGDGIIVAVIDSGLDYNHPDIQGNIWINGGEIPGNGIDDDQNDFIDDVHGWNFVDSNNEIMDFYGHGTHVSGTIAARGNNAIGVIGVAPEATLMTIKGINDAGVVQDAIIAIQYAVMNGADIIHNSWAATSRIPSSPATEDAILFAHSLGAMVVFAAGNRDDDVTYYSPQNMHETITVGASNGEDQRASFSNYGALIDVIAPGVDILSLSARQGSNILITSGSTILVEADYMLSNGTSMAAPHVSGLIALILAYIPTYNYDQVKQVLRFSAEDILTLGFDTDSGHGLLDSFESLNTGWVLRTEIQTPENLLFYDPNEGLLTINGTACNSGFEKYQFFYSLIDDQGNWFPLSPEFYSLVEAGQLAQLELSIVDQTQILLRLQATSIDSREFNDVIQLEISSLGQHTAMITHEPFDQIDPVVSDRYVAWVDYREGYTHPRLYYYDLETSQEFQVPQAEGINPDIWTDKIVWQSSGAIYYYDISSDETQIIASDNASNPVIYNEYIAYERHIDGNSDLYLYDRANQQEYPISVNLTNQSNPSIWGNRIVWQDNRNGSSEVFLCNFDRETGACPIIQITENQGNTLTHVNPDIFDNKIVWNQMGNNSNLYYCIFNEETGNCPAQFISSISNGIQTRPKIFDRNVVWSEAGQEVFDIFHFSIQFGQEQTVAQFPANQMAPAIFDHKIVWHDDRVYNFNIYLHEIQLCEQDLDSSQTVGFTDLALLLSGWGGNDQLGDINGDGDVNFEDLVYILWGWGECSQLTI